MVAWLEENGVGQEKNFLPPLTGSSAVNVIGVSQLIIHWEDGTSTAVPENELPLVLLKTSDIKPSGTGVTLLT
jgi:leucyl-tRNA synthetase